MDHLDEVEAVLAKWQDSLEARSLRGRSPAEGDYEG